MALMHKIFGGIKFKAVFFGALLDLFLSFLTAIILGGLLLFYQIFYSSFIEKLTKVTFSQVVESMTKYNIVVIIVMIIGFLSTVLTGYVTIYLAKNNQINNSIATGVLLTITTIVSSVLYFDINTIIFDIISILLTIPAAYVGGLFYLKTLRKKN